MAADVEDDESSANDAPLIIAADDLIARLRGKVCPLHQWGLMPGVLRLHGRLWPWFMFTLLGLCLSFCSTVSVTRSIHYQFLRIWSRDLLHQGGRMPESYDVLSRAVFTHPRR